MHQLMKGSACTVALIATLCPFANADVWSGKLFVSHQAQHVPPSRQAAARCIGAIQQHWDRRAKLMLDMRGRLRETETQQILFVDGWVWEHGKRVQINHQCTTNKRTEQFALHVQSAEQALIAKQ